MKIYISLPITGHDLNKVFERCGQAASKIREAGHTPVSPLDPAVNNDHSKPYAVLLGNDITALLDCDAAVFLDGYTESRGCTLEFACARIYKKIILLEKDLGHGLKQFI